MNDLVSRLNVTKSRAFLVWLARVAFDLNEEDAIEATSIDGSNDKGIDLFYIDQEEGKVIVVQGKYSDNGAYRAKINSDLSTLQSSLNWLASPEALRKEGKPDLASAADEYLRSRDKTL